MGLDMYLKAEQYVTPKLGWGPDAPANPTHTKLIEAVKFDPRTDERLAEHIGIYGMTVSTTVAYWRKANSIHAWFVDHVQNGQDDCRDYSVTVEQITELRDLAARVLTDPAKLGPELLPSREGFFFGSYDYDEWYVEDLQNTVTQLDAVLDLVKGKSLDLTYQSSW